VTFLHEHARFQDLLKIISDKMSIAQSFVEKDYWIMHCLWGLQNQGFDFHLKGGTSLSKGYNIINRFSEDIDIKILPPKNMNVKYGKNYEKRTTHINSRKAFFDYLVKKIKISGIYNIEYDPDVAPDKKVRNADIRLYYQSYTEQVPNLKQAILLEVGFDDVDPFSEHDISSWALERALKSQVEVKDNRALKIKCYSLGHTLVEKLQAVSTKFRQEQETHANINFMRHYYDIYMLLDKKEVQQFIGTKAYREHKDKRFRLNDEKNLTKNEAFKMNLPQVKNFYLNQYEESKNLFFGQYPSFDEILKRISKYLKKL